MKIVLVGYYPPPYGGISVHVKRMKQYLEKNHIETIVFHEGKSDISSNIRAIKKYRRFIFKIPFIEGDLLHFHIIDKRIRILLGVYKLLGRKIILTLHGESLNNQINNSNAFVRFLLLRSLKEIDKIICVNSKNRSQLLELGFNKEKVIYIPSYINPIEEKEEKDKIPDEIWNYINSSEFLISANGCVRLHNNEDLYGFHMLIELLNQLNNANINAQLLICVLAAEEQSKEERKYYNNMKIKVEELKLSKKVVFYEVQNSEFYPILKKSKLFIRPTNTDGYGVSIAEAIYYNVPSIASDVCVRPEGTLLFKCRDIDDLYEKTIDVIDNYDRYKDSLNHIEIQDNCERLLSIYKEVLK
jgi:glycosyltransferase involved in cell wall biosynthesis